MGSHAIVRNKSQISLSESPAFQPCIEGMQRDWAAFGNTSSRCFPTVLYVKYQTKIAAVGSEKRQRCNTQLPVGMRFIRLSRPQGRDWLSRWDREPSTEIHGDNM